MPTGNAMADLQQQIDELKKRVDDLYEGFIDGDIDPDDDDFVDDEETTFFERLRWLFLGRY